MTVNHFPGNWLQHFTYQAFGFVGDREVFVFLSGLVAAWLSGKAWQRRGTRALVSRLLKGMLRIYAVSMAVTFALLLLTRFGGSRFADWHPLVFYANVSWPRFLVSLITFRHTIAYISLLRFYCILLCLLPCILYLSKKRQERLLLIGAGAIWVVMQLTLARQLPTLDKAWLPWIRIISWQPIYVLGAIIGYRRCISAPSLRPKSRVLFALCAGLAAVLFVLRHQFPIATPHFDAFAGAQHWLIEERILGPLRLLNFLVLLAATWFALPKCTASLERFPVSRWLAYVGRHAIYVFACSVITTYVGFLFRSQLAELPGAGRTVWVAVAVLSLWGAAFLHARLEQCSVRSALNTANVWRIKLVELARQKCADWRQATGRKQSGDSLPVAEGWRPVVTRVPLLSLSSHRFAPSDPAARVSVHGGQ